MRHPDNPIDKEKTITQLFGEFIGFIKSKGLTRGKEFEINIKEIFQCSIRMIWIDQYHPSRKITIAFNSIQMFIEFGLLENNEIIYRKKIDNLRYKISEGEQVELIDSHQKLFDNFFEDFKNKFYELKR